MRLGPDRRVRKRPEFLDLTARGVRVATAHFVLLAARQASLAVPNSAVPNAAVPSVVRPSRLGITASRRVGNAIVRNRLKRLVREAFRAMSGVVPDGHDLLVICRHPGDLSAAQVIQEWDRALPRLLKLIERGEPKATGGRSRA